MRPAPQRTRIGRAGRIHAVWRGLLHRQAGFNPLAGLPAAMQCVAARWRQPVRQDRERLPTRSAVSPPNPDNLVSIVMCRPAPQAMTDDRQVATLRAATWQHTQRNHGHPRNGLVLKLWECDKENHGWREGPPLTVLCESLDPLAGPSPSGKFSSNEKRIQLSHRRRRYPHSNAFGRLFRATRRMADSKPTSGE